MTFEDFLEEWRGQESVITVHTSGSTGTPKTIRLSKDFVRESALRTNFFFSITCDSRLHSCVAPDFIGGKMMAVRSELAGCRLTWETPSNRPLAGMAKDEKIDLLAVVPSQMLYILDNLTSIPELDAIIIGGAAIHPDLRSKIIKSGLNAYETYGMTETASHIALRKIACGQDWFMPLDGIAVSLDPRDCLRIDFNTGETVVTNDIAELNESGGFRILGRYDNMIITGGKKVNPEAVEARIAPVIREFFAGSGISSKESGDNFLITSRPDEKWGEKIVLRIEGRDGDCTSLLKLLREVLNPYEMPKGIEWVDRLPRTPNGKLLRR